MTTPATVKVWDPLVRLFHWSLVICFAGNFLNEDGSDLHQLMGYTACGLIAFRILWGFIGSTHARFGDWVPTPGKLVHYLKALRNGHPPRYLGHNPAAAVMMLTLMSLILTLGVTGYMMDTDAFFGEEWLEELHEAIAYGALGLVSLHVLAAIIESRRHKENLIVAMITGRKQAQAPSEHG